MARTEQGTRRKRRTKKNRKHGRNKAKCLRYRARVGKPRGRGAPGNRQHGRR